MTTIYQPLLLAFEEQVMALFIYLFFYYVLTPVKVYSQEIDLLR